jgi:hypothetical protein
MKKIYQAVSEMVLPGIVFSAVVSILVGAALFDRIGGRMETGGEDFSRMADTQTVQALCERELPVIQCVGKKRWDAGESILVQEVFTALDMDGNIIEPVVLDIIDQDGDSAMGCYNKETGQAIFTARGIYTFLLSATDKQRKRSAGKISLLVDGR